jgi:hypothetical protein
MYPPHWRSDSVSLHLLVGLDSVHSNVGNSRNLS